MRSTNVAEPRMCEALMPDANVAEPLMCKARMPEANVLWTRVASNEGIRSFE